MNNILAIVQKPTAGSSSVYLIIGIILVISFLFITISINKW